MALSVVSAPQGQPSLSVQPLQQAQPVALPVQSAPSAPQPAKLPVQSAPSAPQPAQLPVQSAPSGQQTVAVQIPKLITAVQTALNQGATPDVIVPAVLKANPELASKYQPLLSSGKSPAEVLSAIVQEVSGVSPTDSSPAQTGFIQSLVQSIARPFLRVGVTGYDLAKGVATGLGGDAAKGSEEVDKTRSLGYFGNVEPIKNPVQGAGVGAEIGANFIGGEGAVGAGEDLVKGALGSAVKTGIKEGAISGGMAGLGSNLSSDKASVGGALKETAEGVGLGALTGGAFAGIPAALTGTVRALKDTISPDVVTALTKAIKPGKNNNAFVDDLKLALPDLAKAAHNVGGKVESMDDLVAATTQAKKDVWKEFQGILTQAGKASAEAQTVDGNKIADSMLTALDARFKLQNPKAAAAIQKIADTYRRPISLTEAEDFLESANNDLSGYYAKNKVGQKVAEGDPEKGYVVKEAQALRTELYTKLDELTGSNSSAIKKRYGALSNVQKEAQGRANVVARQNPESLGDQINTIQAIGNGLGGLLRGNFGDVATGAAQFIANKAIKSRNSTEGLVGSAFKKLGTGKY